MSAQMREALTGLIRAYVNLLEIGRDRIVMYGGQCDPVDIMEAGDPALRIARAALAQPDQSGDSPEDRAEQFIQAAIDRAPEPLRRLGEYLTYVLDEDEWPTAESLLLGIATAPPSSSTPDSSLRSALKTIADYDCDSWMVGVKCSGCRTCIAVDALATAPEPPK